MNKSSLISSINHYVTQVISPLLVSYSDLSGRCTRFLFQLIPKSTRFEREKRMHNKNATCNTEHKYTITRCSCAGTKKLHVFYENVSIRRKSIPWNYGEFFITHVISLFPHKTVSISFKISDATTFSAPVVR